VILGNKLDKPRKVNTEIVQEEWVESGKAKGYIETSAKINKGVDEAFKKIAEVSYEFQQKMREIDEQNKPLINMKQLRNTQRLTDGKGASMKEKNRSCYC